MSGNKLSKVQGNCCENELIEKGSTNTKTEINTRVKKEEKNCKAIVIHNFFLRKCKQFL